ncbi:hybrid sensor histidine kinase/response regulator transcription factor [Alistipes sp.]|uniref:hybrid sensor histidine kinase/response regulator transcription factor n=1 Tax=Alistipes sp. TaxID=1872444 RepID=UPI003AF0F341
MTKIKYWLLAAGWFALLPVSAARIEFSSLSVDEGLSQSTVLAIAQDALGRIWLGTQDGLNRYDGYTFTVFRHDERSAASLGDNYVNALLAEGGLMWAGTSSGLSCYDAATDRFENFGLEGRAMQVFDLAALDDGKLLLATDLGVVLFDRATRTMEIKTYLTGISVHTLCPFRDGYLVGTSNGVYTYSATYGNVVRVLSQMARYDVASIIADGDGFWAATHGNGLYRLDEALQVTAHYTAAEHPGLVSDYIRVLKTDAEGRLWIGTFDGLSIRDPRTGRFEQWVHTASPGSLSHNSIRSIFIDSQQGVWLGTYYGGANYYHPLARRFGILRNIPSRNSLGDNTVSCIVEEPAGSLWIGTNDDGVNRYDRPTERFTEYNADNGALLSNNVKCILPDGRGNLWIGTHAGGLSRMEIATRRTRHYRINADIPINNSCYALLDGGDGTLWVGTLSGLLSFDTAAGIFGRHPCADYQPRLASLQINTLLRDSKRRVWIGTASGLYLYLPETHEVRMLDPLSGRDQTLSPPLGQELSVMCVAEDARRNIWVGTRSGLYRFNEHEHSFTRFTVADGLPNDIVYGILEDELGRLWISTNGGLACFDVQRNALRTYTSRDGIANNQFNPYAYYKGRDGVFYFGGIGGLTWFRPHELVDNPFAPAAQVVGVEVADAADDRRVRIERDSLGRVLEAAFPSVRNIFSVRFVAVNPLSGGRNTFAYKLEGFNTRWYETANREASYSNLPPGRYTFRVRAANSDGRWSDDIASVDIRVLPMWWQTLAARILWVVLLLGAIGGVIAAVLGRLKMKMELRLERREKEQIGELSQEKIRFYINLSHELRTPLTLILSPLQEIREHGTADKYVASRLNYIYRNSLKLLHIVNQLLDYRKAELGVFRMKVAVQDVDAIVGEVFSMFEEVAQNRDMDYILSSDLRGEALPVDRMFLEMMLTNLLSNAFKFTPDGGIIRVALQRVDGAFRLSVRDSGSGMTAEQQRHAFDRFYQADESASGGGLGLSIVRRIVELHQGTIALLSEPGRFSEFVITLPADLEVYPAEKRAREDDVRGSIIRDAEQFLPDEWSGDGGAELVPADEQAERQRETILLAEPNAEVCRYIADHFKRHYDVLVVADGNEALEKLKTFEPDLIIADRILPGLDGLKLCQAVKQNIRTCHIPVVLLAPDGGVEEQITGIEAGADGYLPMPLSVSLLRAKVQNLLKVRYRMRHYYSDDAEIDPDKITSNSMDGEFLKKAIRIVEENMDNEEFSSNDFSKALCMSRSNLHLKMKSITGESATKFIRKIRFNYACRLLLERKHSIAEISAMVGFNSPSYFATSFKKHVGCLPTEYVRSRKAERENG